MQPPRTPVADQALFGELAERAPAVMALTEGPEHVITWANALFRATVGNRDVLGLPAARALPELRAQGHLALLDTVFREGRRIQGAELRAELDQRGDGTLAELWFDFTLEPWRGDLPGDGPPLGTWLHAVDVTAKVRARRSAEASRRSLHDIVMQLPALVAIRRGPDHVYEMVNDLFRERVGNRDVIGLPARTAHPEVAAQGMFDRLDAVYRSGDPFHGHESRVDWVADGRTRVAWYDFVYQALRGEGGTIDGTIVHAVDVTDRVLARQEVEAARQRLHDLLRDIDAIAWESPVDSTAFTFVSDAAVPLLGYPVAWWYAPGSWRSIVHPEDRDRVLAETDSAILDRRVCTQEYRVLAADGRVVWLHDVTRVILAADGTPACLRGVMVDISARKAAEAERASVQEQLLHVQKLESLGVLAGGIAHDFNNLLTVVLGNASLAALRLPEAHPARRPVDDLVATAQRAADLARQLLAYSGRAPTVAEPLDLGAQVREIVGLLRATLPRKVEISLRLPDPSPTVEADPAQLQQIVLNLVMNAAEAIGDRGGGVAVHSQVVELGPSGGEGFAGGHSPPPGRYGVLRVEDTGAGMEAGQVARVLDPFYTTKAHGRGLGLAAVAGIVRAHRGGLRVRSTPGQGSTFEVWLPESGRIARRASTAPVDLVRGQGTVLVVDDEPAVRGTCRAMLEHLGYEVIEASDGARGLRRFRREHRSLVAVLLDWAMPVLNGAEVFRELQRIDATVPVLLASGYTEHDARQQGLPAGLAGFLQKPFSVRQLSAALASLPSRRERGLPAGTTGAGAGP